MSPQEQLSRLGISLPSAPKPVGGYVPARQVGDLLFLSGMLPFQEGSMHKPGKLGGGLTVNDGVEAARTALVNVLAVLQQELGSLDRIKSIVRLTGYVASSEGFADQPAVLNGASNLLVEIFGEAGRHARVAIGVSELPMNASVELECIVQVHGEGHA